MNYVIDTSDADAVAAQSEIFPEAPFTHIKEYICGFT